MATLSLDLLLEFAFTAIPLALLAWLCVYISRPIIKQKWAKILSQTAVVFLLFVANIISKASQSEVNSSDTNIDLLLALFAGYFAAKFIPAYLIACYAKSVSKTPYWSFLILLNFWLVLPLMILTFWRPKKLTKLARKEKIHGLMEMIDNPETSQEKRDWATDRLQKLDKLRD